MHVVSLFFIVVTWAFFVHRIFYLDNMDYGPKSLASMDVPRVSLFNAEAISAMIMADCVGLKGGSSYSCLRIREGEDFDYNLTCKSY